jgi:hypothetical protein
MKRYVALAVVLGLVGLLAGCGSNNVVVTPTKSAAGVAQAKASIQTDANGHSIEQANILERLKRDNEPGAIKHLYIISAFNGQVLLYSPVKGKLTSSGKRLTPRTMAPLQWNGASNGHAEYGVPFVVNDQRHFTGEVIQDDGTYGDSVEMVYWFTPDGRYHQHHVGGAMIHISDQPLRVKDVVLTIESK